MIVDTSAVLAYFDAAEPQHEAVSILIDASDEPVGLADASNIVSADVYRTRTVATLDHRHFTVPRSATVLHH